MFSIEKYVAVSNPKDSNKLLVKYGFAPAKNIGDLVHKLESLTYRFKEKGLMDIVNIDTPYKSLIIDLYGESNDDSKKEEKSNCSGVECGCGCDKKSNIEGEPIFTEKEAILTESPVKEISTNKTSASTDKYEKYIMPALVFAGLITIIVLAKK